MSFTLNPVFSGYVSVQTDSNELYKQDIHSFNEATDFIDKYGKSVPGGSLLRATCIPLRTDCWEDFSKDLFLPTFINHAIKVDHVVLKILTSIFAIALDVVTFIPRLIASPFRAIYNHRHKREHPLIELIRNKLEFMQAVKSGVLKIGVNFEKIDIQTGTDLNKKAQQLAVDGYITVAINRLPGFKEQSEFYYKIASYREIEGEWDEQLSATSKSKSLQLAC